MPILCSDSLVASLFAQRAWVLAVTSKALLFWLPLASPNLLLFL